MNAEQTQQTQSPPDKKGGLGKVSGVVARNSGLALALIIVLVVLVVYMYAQRMGWFGLGGGRRSMRGRRRGSAAAEDGDAEDPETNRLLQSINTSQ
jgi:predicted metalloprotease